MQCEHFGEGMGCVCVHCMFFDFGMLWRGARVLRVHVLVVLGRWGAQSE